MLDIRVRKRVARGLFNMSMRTGRRQTRDGRIAQDEGCGQSGIRYTGSQLVPYRQYKLALNVVGSRMGMATYQYNRGAIGHERNTKYTPLCSISSPFFTSIQYFPTELEHHLPNPTNHAHLESASAMLSPSVLHTPAFHSRTSSVASQLSAWTATAITVPTSPITNGTSNALHAPSCSINALITHSFSAPPLIGVSRE